MGWFSEEDFSYGSLADTPEVLEARMRKIMKDIRSLKTLRGVRLDGAYRRTTGN